MWIYDNNIWSVAVYPVAVLRIMHFASLGLWAQAAYHIETNKTWLVVNDNFML